MKRTKVDVGRIADSLQELGRIANSLQELNQNAALLRSLIGRIMDDVLDLKRMQAQRAVIEKGLTEE